MPGRRPIKQAHERAHVAAFLQWFNRAHHCDFRVVSEPDPPDAVICSSTTTRWVEVSTAFWCEDYAIDLNSYATPEERHRPIGPGPFAGMDGCLAAEFVSVVKKKLEKSEYLRCCELYGGPGYLLIPIMHPWLDEHTIGEMQRMWDGTEIQTLGCFRSVYIAFRSEGIIKFARWPINA